VAVRTLGREITYVDAPDDAVRDAPPGFGLDEWFVSALVGLSGLTADPASMAMPARSATPWLTGQPARSLDDLLQEVAPDLKAGSIPVSLMIQAGSSSTAGSLPAFTPPQLLVEQAQ
jgi:hypothetical protein